MSTVVKATLIALAITGVLLLSAWSIPKWKYSHKDGELPDRCTYRALWRESNGRSELIGAVFFRSKDFEGISSSWALSWSQEVVPLSVGGRRPQYLEMQMQKSGIFVNEQLLAAPEEPSLIVALNDKTIKRFPIPKELSEKLSPSQFETDVVETEIWKKEIDQLITRQPKPEPQLAKSRITESSVQHSGVYVFVQQDAGPQKVFLRCAVFAATNQILPNRSEDPNYQLKYSTVQFREKRVFVESCPRGVFVDGRQLGDGELAIVHADLSIEYFTVPESDRSSPGGVYSEERIVRSPVFRNLVAKHLKSEELVLYGAMEEGLVVADARRQQGIRTFPLDCRCDNSIVARSDWYVEGEGKPMLRKAIFTKGEEVQFYKYYSDTEPLWPRINLKLPSGRENDHVDSFPHYYLINGKRPDRGDVFVLGVMGDVHSLTLSDAERAEMTTERFSKPENLMSSDFFKLKVAPLLQRSH